MASLVSGRATAMVPIALLMVCILLPTSEGQVSGDLRLVGGTSNRGRLEIYYSGVWGTVCDDGFGFTEALVACRQLGFLSVSNYGNVDNQGYARGTSQIWLDDVSCSTFDTTLLSCSHNPIGTHNCGHSEDVALNCTSTSTSSPPTPNTLSVRLVRSDGQTSTSLTAGRVEVLYLGQWGTVCDDAFTGTHAGVICRHLGFSGYIRYGTVGSSRVGFSAASSFTPIWLDNNFICSSSDNNINDCTISNIGIHNCGHSEDVAVHCLGDGALRLSGGTTSGRLEIYYSGEWGTVCDDGFGQTDADVACRQLGYNSASNFGSVSDLGYSQASSFTETWLDDVQCRSVSVVTLASCQHNGFGNENCVHSEDVALSCLSSTSISTSSVAIGTIIGILIAVFAPCVCITICVIVIIIAACNSSSNRRFRGNRHVTTTVVGSQQQPKPYPTTPSVAMVTVSQPAAAATYQAPGPQDAPPAYPGVVDTYPVTSQSPGYAGYPPPSSQAPYPTAAPYPQSYAGAPPTQASAPPPQPYPQASAPPPQIGSQQQAPPPGYEVPQYATPQAYPPAHIPGQAVYPNDPSAPGVAPYPTDAQPLPPGYPPPQ